MTKKRLVEALIDHSERTDGPDLIATRGDAATVGDFRLGTREVDWHHHHRGQVFCVESGLMHVRTTHGSWLLPPQRAGWIPPGEPHKVSISGVTGGWSLFIAPRACRPLPRQPCVIGLNELMLALVRRAVVWSDQDVLATAQKRMMAVLLEEIRNAPHEPLHLPMPSDRRLLRIAQAILKHPHDARTIEQWAHWAGLSVRSLSRLFLTETALSFAQWRQQARLTLALEMLANDVPVAEIADALGYATPSNFIAMFRRSFGDTPSRYFARRG
ncbi:MULTISPECIES: helix-turn-helix transcriptional regulator [unclassified Dyella]|uniref:AraC family transcriptional regulator n=1 Tax=unclassified Dyella TaxID=2634549 RepID=UPI000C82ED62|nr:MULTISPECIES: helix-turn-helix transcriptional regulator [unclassified Dyella]MDR3447984.1 helix-turn-helix transcriptional regulator [Dyella sp.]PMQ03580.1 HTH-type transcriptional repressor of iron proteins A [Dyella sp. AD56]